MPLVVINKTSEHFTKETAKQYIQQNKIYLSESDVRAVQSAHFLIIPQANKEGKYPPLDIDSYLKKEVGDWKDKGKWGDIDVKLNK